MTSATKQIALASALGYLLIVLQLIGQAFLTPYVVSSIGAESLGKYSFVFQYYGILTLLEMGFTPALTQFLTKSRVGGEERAHFIDFQAGIIGIVLFSLLTSLPLIIISIYSDNIFQIESLKLSEASYVSWMLAVCILCRAPFLIFRFSLISMNQQWKSHVGSIVGLLTRLFVSVILIEIEASWFALIKAFVLSELVSNIFLFFIHPKINWKVALANRRSEVIGAIQSMVKFGFKLVPMQITSRIMFATDSIVIGMFHSASTVAIFYSSQMPSFLAFQSLFIFADSMLPTLTTMYSSGHVYKFRKLVLSSIRMFFAMGVGLAVGILCFNESVVVHWLGRELYAGNLVTVPLAFFSFAQIVSHLLIIVLISISNMEKWANVSLLSSFTKLVVSVLLCKFFDYRLVMLASLVVEIPIMIFLLKRVIDSLQVDYKYFVMSTIKKQMPFVGFVSAVGVLSSIILTYKPSLTGLVSAIAFYMSLSIISFYYGILTANERSSVYDKLSTYF